jgi:hypothetical protein
MIKRLSYWAIILSTCITGVFSTTAEAKAVTDLAATISEDLLKIVFTWTSKAHSSEDSNNVDVTTFEISWIPKDDNGISMDSVLLGTTLLNTVELELTQTELCTVTLFFRVQPSGISDEA